MELNSKAPPATPLVSSFKFSAVRSVTFSVAVVVVFLRWTLTTTTTTTTTKTTTTTTSTPRNDDVDGSNRYFRGWRPIFWTKKSRNISLFPSFVTNHLQCLSDAKQHQPTPTFENILMGQRLDTTAMTAPSKKLFSHEIENKQQLQQQQQQQQQEGHLEDLPRSATVHRPN